MSRGTEQLKPEITTDPTTGSTKITYTFTCERFAEMCEADTGYNVRQDVERRLADMVSQAFFEKHKDDLLKQISFDEIKSILLMTASKELMQKLSEMTGRNY